MGERRREVIVLEAKRLFVGACCAIGGLAGVWTAIWSLPMTERHGGIGTDLVAMALPVLGHLVLGLAAGSAPVVAILLLSRFSPKLGFSRGAPRGSRD
jgi:hypothetical protein